VRPTCEELRIGFVPFSPLGAASVELTADDLCEIEDGAAGIETQGARLPQAALEKPSRWDSCCRMAAHTPET